jgi:hypothetical protein
MDIFKEEVKQRRRLGSKPKTKIKKPLPDNYFVTVEKISIFFLGYLKCWFPGFLKLVNETSEFVIEDHSSCRSSINDSSECKKSSLDYSPIDNCKVKYIMKGNFFSILLHFLEIKGDSARKTLNRYGYTCKGYNKTKDQVSDKVIFIPKKKIIKKKSPMKLPLLEVYIPPQ